MKKTKTSKSFNNIVIFILAGFLLVGGYLYSTMQSSTINYIGGGEVGLGMPAPTSPSVSRVCATVSSFSLSNNCGATSYGAVSFTCSTSSTVNRLGGTSSCKSYESWYMEAKSTCATKCIRPTPTPTCKPRPACLDYKYPCRIADRPGMYCPRSSMTPTPKPSTTAYPSPSIQASTPPGPCAQVYGSCIVNSTYSGAQTCMSYSDSCKMSIMCAKPYTACSIVTPAPPEAVPVTTITN